MSQQVALFEEFETNLAAYKDRYDGVIYDLADEDENKQARSDKLAIGKVIARLDTAHKEAKAPLKEKVDLIDGERKRIKDGLLLVQDGIKSQLVEHEAKIEAHESALLARVEAIKALQVFDIPMTVDLVTERLEQACALVIDDSFQHYEKEAVFARVKVIEYLSPVLVGLVETKKAAEEEERQREEQAAAQQKLREEQIARDAASAAEQKAKEAQEREAQAAIQAKENAKAAAKKAEQDKAHAVRAAEDKAQREAKIKELQESERIKAEQAVQARRDGDIAHCGKINREAAAQLCAIAGTSEETARAVITAIAKGVIPAVSITY